MKHLFLSLTIILFIKTGFAQQLNTDRPDQSDGATTVDKGRLQLETSLYHTTIDVNQHALISSSLLRYGLIDKLELRLLAEQGHHRDLFLEQTAHSQFPLAVSLKWSLVSDRKTLPDISIVSYLQLPLTNGNQPSLWSPAVILIMEKQWKPFTLTLNAGPKQEAFSHDWDLQTTADLKIDLNDHWQIFGEYFSQFGHSLPFHNIDAGILCHLTKKWMIHASAGTSIHHQPENYFVNSGFAVQIN